MTIIIYLIPVAFFLGALGLTAFLWAARTGQFEDLEGAAHRILIDEDKPLDTTMCKISNPSANTKQTS
jgi:cbb3-type cytochrome oxidase maturation protein